MVRVATMKKRRLLIVGIEVEVILGDLRVPPLLRVCRTRFVEAGHGLNVARFSRV